MLQVLKTHIELATIPHCDLTSAPTDSLVGVGSWTYTTLTGSGVQAPLEAPGIYT